MSAAFEIGVAIRLYRNEAVGGCQVASNLDVHVPWRRAPQASPGKGDAASSSYKVIFGTLPLIKYQRFRPKQSVIGPICRPSAQHLVA